MSFAPTNGGTPVTVELFDDTGSSLTSVASNTGAGGDFSLDFALSCSDFVSKIVINSDGSRKLQLTDDARFKLFSDTN